MIRKVGLVCLIAGMAQGCAGINAANVVNATGMLRGVDRRDLPPINVSGTTYEIFELSRPVNESVPLSQDYGATIVYYAVVGPGRTLYCGRSASDCAGAIRKFNEKPYKTDDERIYGGGM